MKKIVLALLAGMAITATVSAQSYTVQSVTGRVQREVSQQAAGNSRIDIAVGDVLSADTVIHTGIGAALVVRVGERTVHIPAAQNGARLSELAANSTGVRISGNVTQVDTGAVSRTTTQIGTASARASDAAEDDDIPAE